MTARGEVLLWLAVLGAASLFLWALGAILPPFVLGMAIGYFLDPIVERLSRRRMTRATAAGVLILGSFVVGTVAAILLLPPLVEQTVEFARQVPVFAGVVHDRLQPYFARLMARVGAGAGADLENALRSLLQHGMDGVAAMLGELVSRGVALVNLASLLALTPLVAFYLLRDWPRIIAVLDDLLPRAHAATIREQARAMDAVLAGFARGAAIVCAALGLFYAVALTALGLDFGLVIGLAAGALSFVPYLGFLFGFTASVGVAMYQFWPDGLRVGLVLAVFLGGQIVSDYILTPRLVGERIGLHPLWVIFGVFAGGALFGFVGVLLSVPVCAAAGVLTRFALGRYKKSSLYRRDSETPGPGKDPT